tara:strand:- start:95 stop:301 length:207 start_codon:yes stop_codon:yes gene_type:complete
MERSYWYGLVIDPDFDTMFTGPVCPCFQEEPYQGKASVESQVFIRKGVMNKPPIGKHSSWPEERRTKQ